MGGNSDKVSETENSSDVSSEGQEEDSLYTICDICYMVHIISHYKGKLNIKCNHCKINMEIYPEYYYEMLQKLNEDNPEGMKKIFEICHDCKREKNQNYCQNCLYNFCSGCKLKHKNHSIINLKNYKSKNNQFKIKSIKNSLKESLDNLTKFSKEITNKISNTLNRSEQKEIEEKYKMFKKRNNLLFTIMKFVLATFSQNNYESISNAYNNLCFTKVNKQITNKIELIEYYENNFIIESKIGDSSNIYNFPNFISNENEKQNPFDEAYKLNIRGEYLFKIKKYNEAISNFNNSIKLDPKTGDYYNNKAKCLKKLNNYSEALSSSNLAIKLAPLNPSFYNTKGLTLKKLNKIEEAIISYDKAIELNKNFDEAYFNKANCLEKLNKNIEAINNYDNAIKINPNVPDYYINKGLCLKNQKKYKGALINYDKAIELAPNSANYYFNKALSLDDLNNYEQAMVNYNKAIELDPKNDVYYYNRAICLDNMGKIDDAVMNYDKAIELNPKNADYYNNKGLCLVDLKNYHEALNYFDNAIKLDPSVNEYYKNKNDCNNFLNKK